MKCLLDATGGGKILAFVSCYNILYNNASNDNANGAKSVGEPPENDQQNLQFPSAKLCFGSLTLFS